MAVPFVAPELEAKAFNCPLCHAYASQTWTTMMRGDVRGGFRQLGEYAASHCSHCNGWLTWYQGRILVPDVTSAPAPNEGLSEDIKADYAEAASISAKSPRGAAALLRLALQKLCVQLGEGGENINEDIGALVAKGLDVRIEQALDTIRVVGNEAVHPGELDLRDDPEVVGMLFTLINTIAMTCLPNHDSEPSYMQSFRKESLPESRHGMRRPRRRLSWRLLLIVRQRRPLWRKSTSLSLKSCPDQYDAEPSDSLRSLF